MATGGYGCEGGGDSGGDGEDRNGTGSDKGEQGSGREGEAEEAKSGFRPKPAWV